MHLYTVFNVCVIFRLFLCVPVSMHTIARVIVQLVCGHCIQSQLTFGLRNKFSGHHHMDAGKNLKFATDYMFLLGFFHCSLIFEKGDPTLRTDDDPPNESRVIFIDIC